MRRQQASELADAWDVCLRCMHHPMPLISHDHWCLPSGFSGCSSVITERTACLQDVTNVSMWEAGNLYIAAAREVAYVAANKEDGYNITSNRFWLYVQNNGPTILDHGYDSSMDILVRSTSG
jgi:hypothetical protein